MYVYYSSNFKLDYITLFKMYTTIMKIYKRENTIFFYFKSEKKNVKASYKFVQKRERNFRRILFLSSS